MGSGALGRGSRTRSNMSDPDDRVTCHRHMIEPTGHVCGGVSPTILQQLAVHPTVLYYIHANPEVCLTTGEDRKQAEHTRR